ncbi:pectin lyase fold virulence factor, partial [Nannochloropsis oceanica]
MNEAGPQEESRRRRRRVLLGSLGAVCLIVGAALAITFAGKGQGKNKPEPAATVEGGVSPMGDLPGLVKDSVLSSNAATTGAAPKPVATMEPLATTVTPAVPTASKAAPAQGTGDLTFAQELLETGTVGGVTLGAALGALPGASTVNGAFNELASDLANLAGLRTCSPVDGPDLERMVAGSSTCGVILLTKGSMVPYHTEKTMVVSTRKIIVGHPIDLPQIITARKVERVFDVVSGGSLDIRFVTIFRAFGYEPTDELRIITGGVALVRLGGFFRGTAVIFRDPTQNLAGFQGSLARPYQRRRTYGGHVLVMGGSFFCYGCQVIRWAPYGLVLLNVFQVGRDFLVVAGTSVMVGMYHLFFTPFLSGISVGNAIAVLGGVSVRIGGGTEGVAVLVGQFGAGQNIFVGGGVLVNVGHQQQTAFVCLMRAGYGMTALGAGVFIHIAELENRAWGAAAIVGAGQVYSNGAGVFDKTGGEVVNSAISAFQALVGGSAYFGTGDMNIVGEQFARLVLTLDQNGVGMTWFNGAGSGTLILTPSMVIALVRSQKILGAEVFQGAGFFTEVNGTRWTFQLVNAQIPGYEGWIGLGAALLVRTRTTVRRLVNYRAGKKVAWVVNGVGVNESLRNNFNILATKNGTQALKPQPTKPGKHRLLEAVDDLVSSAVTRAGRGKGRALMRGFSRPALSMADSVMDSKKIQPPNPGILAEKLQALVSGLKNKRRLQGQPAVNPTRIMNMFNGLSPASLMKAWQEAVDEANSSPDDRALAAGNDADEVDADGRWGEQVYVGGGDASQCVLCGVGPGTTESHWNRDAGDDPATCHITEACTPADSVQGIMGKLRGALPDGEDLVVPPVAKGWAKTVGSKYTARILQDMDDHQAENPGADVKLPDTNILTYDIFLYCPVADAECEYSQADMKTAFQDYLDDVAQEETAFRISSATAAVHPAIFKSVNDADESFVSAIGAPALEGCGKGLSFSLFVT